MGISGETSSSGDQDQLNKALLFAQQIADHEIESIERIHKRTLQSFGFIGAFAGALFAVIGFIGYSNLKNASIATARAQMQREVSDQVRQKLTTDNINQIVKDQLRDLSNASLKEEIHKELTSPPLYDSIRQAAHAEAQRQISSQFSPRHLTSAQSRLFVEQLTESKELLDYPVAVAPWAANVEATGCAAEIKESLTHGKLKIIETASFNQPPIEGIGIYYSGLQSLSYAQLLQNAFRAAGVSAKLVPGVLVYSVPTTDQKVVGQKIPLEVWVGSKPLQ